MSNRPTVGILGADGKSSGKTHTLPAVFSSPIRSDIVQYEASPRDTDLEKFLEDMRSLTMPRTGPSTLASQRTRDNHMP